jgi:hypothetical protein
VSRVRLPDLARCFHTTIGPQTTIGVRKPTSYLPETDPAAKKTTNPSTAISGIRAAKAVVFILPEADRAASETTNSSTASNAINEAANCINTSQNQSHLGVTRHTGAPVRRAMRYGRIS